MLFLTYTLHILSTTQQIAFENFPVSVYDRKIQEERLYYGHHSVSLMRCNNKFEVVDHVELMIKGIEMDHASQFDSTVRMSETCELLKYLKPGGIYRVSIQGNSDDYESKRIFISNLFYVNKDGWYEDFDSMTVEHIKFFFYIWIITKKLNKCESLEEFTNLAMLYPFLRYGNTRMPLSLTAWNMQYISTVEKERLLVGVDDWCHFILNIKEVDYMSEEWRNFAPILIGCNYALKHVDCLAEHLDLVEMLTEKYLDDHLVERFENKKFDYP